MFRYMFTGRKGKVSKSLVGINAFTFGLAVFSWATGTYSIIGPFVVG